MRRGGAVAGDGGGMGREGIADEVADGEVHVERQVGVHECKAAGHNGFQAMLLAHKRAEVFGGELGLAVGRAGFSEERSAWPVFGNGSEIGGLGAVDGARAGEQEAASSLWLQPGQGCCGCHPQQIAVPIMCREPVQGAG